MTLYSQQLMIRNRLPHEFHGCLFNLELLPLEPIPLKSIELHFSILSEIHGVNYLW